MTAQISSIVFALTIYILTVLEKHRINSVYTPFTVAAWPFVFITLVVNFGIVFLGFQTVTVRVNFFILINLIVIWIVGYILSYFIEEKNNNIDYPKIFQNVVKYKILLVIFSWIVFFIVINRLLTLTSAHGGLWYMGTNKFEKEMIVGLPAHAAMFGKACFIFLFMIFKSSKRKIIIFITLTALAISIIAMQVKYHFLWLILMMFFLNNLNKPFSIQIKKIIRISLILTFVFISYFAILTIAWKTFSFTNPRIWEFFAQQFSSYLFSGPVVLEHWLNLDGIKPDWTLFVVLINVKNVILGIPDRINALYLVSHGFIKISSWSFSNVGTSFGVYYMIGGFTFTLFCTTIVSLISYFFYFIGRFSKNQILIMLNVLFLTIGTLSFFVQYFTLLSLYEFIFFLIFLSYLFKILDKVKNILYKSISI